MLTSLSNFFIAHQLGDLEELFDVEVLLAGNDVEHFVVGVFVILERLYSVEIQCLKRGSDLHGQVAR